jgi:hypothetical protein
MSPSMAQAALMNAVRDSEGGGCAEAELEEGGGGSDAMMEENSVVRLIILVITLEQTTPIELLLFARLSSPQQCVGGGGRGIRMHPALNALENIITGCCCCSFSLCLGD